MSSCPIYGSRQWDDAEPGRARGTRPSPGVLAVQPVPARRAGRADRGGPDRRVGPDMDSKFYAATQTMDEARHVELYQRFIRDKIGLYYPINDDLARLLADALSDSRWDLPYLGMQVLIEGLALAAFGVHRDVAANPLVKQLLAYVMQDEARHVAFGRLALRDYYAGADRGRAGRARGVRGRGLLPDAQPVPRPGGLGADGLRRGGVPGVHRARRRSSRRSVAAVQPDRAVREGHRAVGPEGPARLRRPGRAGRRPAPTWTR